MKSALRLMMYRGIQNKTQNGNHQQVGLAAAPWSLVTRGAGDLGGARCGGRAGEPGAWFPEATKRRADML